MSEKGVQKNPKAGISIPHITLPKGGGAISGMGEKSQSNPVTGTASFQVPVKISPSRNEFQPQIALSYDSGNGNSAFGLGWSIGIPSITRKTQKALPKYDDQNESDVFLFSGSEDLVPFLEEKNGEWKRKIVDFGQYRVFSYRPRTESSFSRIERWCHRESGLSHWVVKTKDNLTSVFGEHETSRIANPANQSQVFQWLLERTFDDKGNCIEYGYKHEDTSRILHEKTSEQNRKAFANSYLKRIRYGNTIPVNRHHGKPDQNCSWLFEVVFDYGEHPGQHPGYNEIETWLCRRDPHSDFRAGFEIRTYRLCQRILMFHRFRELGEQPCLVASTNLEYEETPALTFLKSVQQWSYQPGKEASPFPPVNFLYSKPSISPATFFEIDERDPVYDKVDFNRIQWTDLFGEGISGLLYEDDHAWWYKRNTSEAQGNQVQFNSFLKIADHPSLTKNKSNSQLADIDGDGNLEVVVRSNGISGFFRKEDQHWQNFTSFIDNPNINWKDPNLRMIDLTGDGNADILISEDHCFTWYESKIKEGYGARQRELIPFDKVYGPDLVFNDATQSVYLADMSGDGLTDIVRIRNGEVCYWPNLGYGKFGKKIILDHSPHFDHPDQFDQKRIRLADIDGSGTTDVLYICRDRISYWINQSGNSFSDAIIVTHSGSLDNLSHIQTIDLFGKGTSCLVISNPASGKLRYIDLMADGKPYLLLEVNNNMGTLSRFHYSTSTKFYQQDEKNGTPWITKLPFPVHVVEKTETIDLIDNARFIAHYAYHHGYYDGVEREFRGFGMVEQWDTELYEDHIRLNEDSIEEELYAPPVYTKTWFHTGFLKHKEKITEQYASEYYQGDSESWSLTQPSIPENFEAREAARAFKGSVLRQEVYSKDGSEKETHPYTVTSYNYNIRQLQPEAGNEHSVFHVIPAETLTCHYERNPDDPRISHQINLEIDAFGNVIQSIAISYPRRKPAFEEQRRLLAVLSHKKVININDQPDWYRIGVLYQSEQWEVCGFSFSGQALTAEIINEVLNKAVTLPYEDKMTPDIAARREVDEQRIYFYNDALSNKLPLGELAFHALPYDTYQKSMTPALFQEAYGSRLNDSVLKEAGYIIEDDVWWLSSGKVIFDAQNFYLPVESIDPLGNRAVVEYDLYHLFPVRAIDAASNESLAHYNYRVLQAYWTTDPNGNHQVVAFDTRGHVIATAVVGKNGEGDSLEDPTSRLEYDIFNWKNKGKPNFVKTFTREQHKNSETPWQISYSYSNGLGKEILKKIPAEDGDAFSRNNDGSLRRDKSGKPIVVETSSRWVGNGRVILNNKGKPVKKYEPYFTDTPDYEDESELREYGVTPVIHYDPLERVVRTDLPDGTFTKTWFDGWKKLTYDANDTILESEWYRKKILLDKASSDYRAAQLAAKHANTPHLIYFDSLGREFLTVEDNAEFGKYSTRIEFDIEGKQRSITDAKGRIIARYEYDILGKQIYSWMADAGERWTFYSLFSEEAKEEGKESTPLPLILWESRPFTKRIVYDALHRVTQVWLKEEDEKEKLIEWNVYGEEHPNPLPSNLRGKVWLDIDQAGLTKNCFFDFKGNVLETQYKPSSEYKQTIDWQFLPKTDIYELENEASSFLEKDTYITQNQYDALNRIIVTIHPDGTEIKPLYNKAGLLEKVSARLRGDDAEMEFVDNIDYDEKGQRTAIYYGNNTKTCYRYDEKNFRLTRLFTTRKSDNTFLQDLHYTYDPAGNITEIKDEAQQTVFFNNAMVDAGGQYEYDAIYRLVKATGRELTGQSQTDHNDSLAQYSQQSENTQALRRYTQRYTFDALGNILSMSHHADGGNWKRYYRYKPENNHLLETSNAGEDEGARYSDKYIHDAHGNMTRMPHLQNILWNFNNQTTQVDLGGGGKAYYAYNSGGQRTRKVIERIDGKIIERFYIGSFEVYRERRNESVELERETLFIGDDKKRIAQVDTVTIQDSTPITRKNIRYQYSNHLGSASLELDENASIISYEEYHPFGTSAYRSGKNESEVSLKRYRYSGKERDEETGLYYYGARHLIAWLGRWSSADPAGFVDGLNVFGFVRNNPASFIDRAGLSSEQRVDIGVTYNLTGDKAFNKDLRLYVKYQDTNMESPYPEKTFWNTGGREVVTGSTALVVSVAVLCVITGPIGWFVGIMLAFGIAGGIATTSMGAARLATSDKLSPEENYKMDQDVQFALGASTSPGKILGGTIGVVVNGKEGMKMGSEIGGTIESLIPTKGPVLKGPGIIEKADPKKIRQKVLDEIPALDHSSKVAPDLLKLGKQLPAREVWSKYPKDELKVLLEDLKKSVKNRDTVNKIHPKGADYIHGKRLSDEHRLIRDIEKFLRN